MKDLFDEISNECSKLTTEKYSTSFSSGIMMLGKNMRTPIYNIYGFVRFADEIVDSFHKYNKSKLLAEFKNETFSALKEGISLNPILNSFQKTVNIYKIDHQLIKDFFKSMEMDLKERSYDNHDYEKYIHGSAKVVGLMCLKIFVKGNQDNYLKLKKSAMSLGSAFQKINFLRDIKDDVENLGRVYFPDIEINSFNENDKKIIEKNIEYDFANALNGIKQLPNDVKGGVYLAYSYYFNLFKKIRSTSSKVILQKRIRINNFNKFIIMLKVKFKHYCNLI